MTLAAATVIDTVSARLVPMTATGGRVYTSRAWPLSLSDLPAWRVTAQDEIVQPASLDGLQQEHRLTVQAACSARATADLDDTLHALAASGLTLLFAPEVPYRLELVRISRSMQEEDGASIGVITLQMNATFYTSPAAPETIV
jgi:hypothetical protein